MGSTLKRSSHMHQGEQSRICGMSLSHHFGEGFENCSDFLELEDMD